MSMRDIQSEIYERKLQFLERRYYRAPNSVYNVMFRIKGNFTKEQLRGAILKAQKRHVLLRARVFMDKEYNVWLTTKNVKGIPIEVIKRSDKNHWTQICIKEDRVPLDYSNQPPIKFILLYSKNSSDLIVKANHMFTDALGVCYLVRDILEYLGNPNKKVEVLPPPPIITRDEIPLSDSRNYIAQGIIKLINKIWQKQKIVFDEEDYKNIFKAYWEIYTNKNVGIELNRDETLKLINRCRKESVTVNSALIAAFIRAQSKVKGFVENQKGGFSVDIRDKLTNPVGQFFGVYATGIFLSFKDKSKKSFWEFSRYIHKRINKKMDKKAYHINLLRFRAIDPLIYDAAVIKMYGNLVPKGYSRFDKNSSYSKKRDIISLILKIEVPKRIGFGLTNLGRLDIPCIYGNLELDRISILPYTASNTEAVIGIVTVGDKFSLRISYIDNITNNMLMNGIIEKISEILNKEIGL